MIDSSWEGRRLHFVGIGGAGMSGLAHVARELGASVTGSDRALDGHDAANVPDGAEVVVSTAIPPDNPELVRAHDLGLSVLHRGDLLAEVAALKRSIAVSGAHGKTTTSAMTAHILGGPYVIGAELAGANAAWGDGDWVVVEADESDRSFLKLEPDVAVITNIELDHHATYGSDAELRAAFDEFAMKAGKRIAWTGAGIGGDAIEYGIGEGAIRAEDVRLGDGGSSFSVDGVEVRLQVPGEHNVLNALAAIAAAREAGASTKDAAGALAGFRGTGRRFESRGTTSSGARVYDDYAHHPTEVAATLAAARTLDPRRLVAVFQPHLYSRTQALADRFGRALAEADAVVVVDIYPARERAEDFPGVSGRLVAAAAAKRANGRPVAWLPSMDDAERWLRSQLRDGDLLLTLGAGDVDRLAKSLTE